MAYRSGATKAAATMAAKASTSSPSPLGLEDKSKNGKWVNVAWMPHASLSQTSHVSLCIRSAQIRSYDLAPSQPEEWQVQVTVHGIGGLPLVVVASSTPTAPVVSSFLPSNKSPMVETNKHSTESSSSTVSNEKKQLVQWAPTISNATIACQWDFVIQMPVRWRDLPRDAFLRFQVTGKCNEVVRKKYEYSLFKKKREERSVLFTIFCLSLTRLSFPFRSTLCIPINNIRSSRLSYHFLMPMVVYKQD
jgi:hypothetical protein